MPKMRTVREYQQRPSSDAIPARSTGSVTMSVSDADRVDGFDASATALANTICALNSSAKGPFSITGDADSVDGYQAAALAVLAENESVSVTISVPMIKEHTLNR